MLSTVFLMVRLPVTRVFTNAASDSGFPLVATFCFGPTVPLIALFVNVCVLPAFVAVKRASGTSFAV